MRLKLENGRLSDQYRIATEITVQINSTRRDLMLIQHKFYWISNRSNVAELIWTVTATDTGCIVSNRTGFCCIGENPILCASLQIWELLTGCTTLDDQRTFAPVTRRARAVWSLIRERVGGAGGGRLTWYQPPHDTKMAQYWVLATSDRWCHTPSTRRKW